MKIWHGLERLPERLLGVCASIGNYDGVHLGHRAILDAVVDDARKRQAAAMLLSFEPHPLEIVAPERRPRRLQTRRQQIAALEECGLSDFVLVRFTPEIARLSGETFFADVLAPRLDVRSIHVGANFRFGHERSGDVALLRAIGARRGFEVHGVEPVRMDGAVVSSSRIRTAVEEGEVEDAARWLGRPFAVDGEIVRGEGRGRTIGFPTANLALASELVPLPGVYVTEALVLAGRFAGLTNVGHRPTFGDGELTVETHLLDFADDLYGERLELRFLARIRDEMRFDSASDLADQIARDRAAAESYLQNLQLRTT